MRVSKAGLLVVLALLAPLLVEMRTIFVWVGVELSVLQTALVGLAIVGVILVWAFLPEDDGDVDSDDESETETDSGRDLANGD